GRSKTAAWMLYSGPADTLSCTFTVVQLWCTVAHFQSASPLGTGCRCGVCAPACSGPGGRRVGRTSYPSRRRPLRGDVRRAGAARGGTAWSRAPRLRAAPPNLSRLAAPSRHELEKEVFGLPRGVGGLARNP